MKETTQKEKNNNNTMKSFRTSTTIAILTALVALAVPATAQQKSTDRKIRIFVTTDNPGGANPRTLEVSGLLAECHKPNVTITSDPNAADYVLDFRREGGKRSTSFARGGLPGLAISAASKVDHATLYANNGDMIASSKARTVSGAVKDMCSRF